MCNLCVSPSHCDSSRCHDLCCCLLLLLLLLFTADVTLLPPPLPPLPPPPSESFSERRTSLLRGAVRGTFFKPALPAQLVENSEACKVNEPQHLYLCLCLAGRGLCVFGGGEHEGAGGIRSVQALREQGVGRGRQNPHNIQGGPECVTQPPHTTPPCHRDSPWRPITSPIPPPLSTALPQQAPCILACTHHSSHPPATPFHSSDLLPPTPCLHAQPNPTSCHTSPLILPPPPHIPPPKGRQ